MKTLAELKRRIQPGVKLLCVENTYRPELNGKTRVVCRVQTNAFTWKHEGETHELVQIGTDEHSTRCSCGAWTYKPSWRDEGRPLIESINEAFLYHRTAADKEAWTNYEKASLYTFAGDRFTFGLGSAGDGHKVTLEVL